MSKNSCALVVLLAAGCAARARSTSAVAIMPAQDSARVTWLKAEGQVSEGRRVIVWAPRAVPRARFEALRDTLDRGVHALEEILSPARSWSRLRQKKITYYLSPDSFVSHASGEGTVFISWWRAERGLAPYKHEAAHEILVPQPPYWPEEYPDSIAARERERNWPGWLTEGLPDYVAHHIAAESGIAEGDIFQSGGPTMVDRTCRERQRGEFAAMVSRYVPGRGRPAELSTSRRREVAPVFYPCSHSFVKFLVGRIGLAAVIGLVTSRDVLASIEALSGKPVALLQEEWQRHLAVH